MTFDEAAYHRAYHAENRDARNAARKARHAKNKDQHRTYCKQYREQNSDRVKLIKNLRYAAKRDTFEGRAEILWRSAGQRARMRNEQFSLTLQHVKNGMAGRCPKTGVFFDLSPRGTSSNPYAPSVDKRNRLLPYSDENVQIVCWAYNRMKSDMSDEDLLFFCKLIAGVQP